MRAHAWTSAEWAMAAWSEQCQLSIPSLRSFTILCPWPVPTLKCFCFPKCALGALVWRAFFRLLEPPCLELEVPRTLHSSPAPTILGKGLMGAGSILKHPPPHLHRLRHSQGKSTTPPAVEKESLCQGMHSSLRVSGDMAVKEQNHLL